MNKQDLVALVVVLGVLAAAGTWYLRESSSYSTLFPQLRVEISSQPSSSSTLGNGRAGNTPLPAEPNTYVNQAFDYSFNMPVGYQLATDVMLFLNSTSGYPVINWSATNTQNVVITKSSPTDQQEFLRAAERGKANIALNPVADLAESIYIAAVAPTLSELESTLTRLRLLHPDLANVSPIQHVVISNAAAIRYTTFNLNDRSSEEVLYISFPGQARLPSGLPVGTILLLSDNTIDKNDGSALDQVIATFRFK